MERLEKRREEGWGRGDEGGGMRDEGRWANLPKLKTLHGGINGLHKKAEP